MGKAATLLLGKPRSEWIAQARAANAELIAVGCEDLGAAETWARESWFLLIQAMDALGVEVEPRMLERARRYGESYDLL